MRKRYSLCRVAFCFSSGFLMMVLLFSCKKESPQTAPTIEFIHDIGYASGDTALGIGTKINIGIRAKGISENITYLNVSIDNGSSTQTLLDSGLNSTDLSWSYPFIKTSSPTERWIFTVMDKNRNKSTITLTFTKGVTLYGNIISFNNVSLGAQLNTQYGSFFSFGTGQTYLLADAFINQSSIDMVYYYGTYFSTLASANEVEAPNYFTGTNGIANWSVKNETRYDTTDVSISAFDNATNDSLILAVYNPVDAKRKAKYLAPGMLLSFIDHEGKLGMIKVNEVTPGDTGHVVLNIKRQQ